MIKKAMFTVIILSALVFMFCTSAFAVDETNVLSDNNTYESGNITDTEFVENSLEEPPNKKIEWAYWLIGFGAIAAVVASAVVVSRKVK